MILCSIEIRMKEVTSIMKKKFGPMFFAAFLLLHGSFVHAEVDDYKTVTGQADDKAVQSFSIDDGNGNTVKVAACSDRLYVTAKTAVIRSVPGENGSELMQVGLGEEVMRSAVCDNNWSKVSLEKDGNKVNGYIQNHMLSDDIQIQPAEDQAEVKTDSSILDYPGRKDGEIVGEVLELDEVKRTGTVNGVWSRIVYQDESGAEQTGYIPTSVLDLPETSESADAGIDKELNAGTLHESSGKGVFAEAVEAGTTVSEENGVLIGTPVAASSDANLKPLGKFRITHYCPCSICCGPWANGITSTGVTATTNHTIAVDPSQIPYGSQVVINGQVYVAEDCGGAIKTNCIDIYVATHEEGESKGVYYTDVYLIR